MRAALLLAVVICSAGCIDRLDRCAGREVAAGAHLECPMPGWTNRAFDLHLPAGWDGVSPLPVVIDIHGGGGKRSAAARGSCPGADLAHPSCMHAQATALGFAVVYPDGTGAPFKNVRTWNAGGGAGRFQCVSGPACRGGVDDLAYFDDLLDELELIIPVDQRRIYATGLSNGGAMSHRLGCQRADRFAAIAPVGGGNQWAESGGDCPAQTPVLHMHGSEDGCWQFEEGPPDCGPLQDTQVHVGIPETMEGWRLRNGCAATFTDEALPDTDPQDGATSIRRRWDGCAAATELILSTGAGHTWPDGDPLLDESIVGRTTRDFNANQVMLEFFLAHPKP